MKYSLRGLLQLKPFDDTADSRAAGPIYASSPLLAAGIVISASLGILSLGLLLFGHESAITVLGLSIATSAVTSGLEWHAGLKARALNQIFVTVVLVSSISLFKITG